ncbi:hypothetical protein BC659_2586 [Sediminibacterium goheungense]|uniref:Uncharacterized protein n=2 Tax=Sediminibacterium goheungense TaxID=1086393 RepID=A0A4R6IT26_9BACT|nr:hypothetical protein BC659_2586 [Sediminibacterium goheungense]
MDIVEPKDSEISLPLMKTNRHTYTGKSPVRLDESQQQKSSATVKSLPAVRAFSNVPVQKKTEELNGDTTESLSGVPAVQMAGIGEADEEAPLAASASAFSSAPSKRPGLWDRFKAGASSVGSSIASGASSLWSATKSGASAAGSAIASGASAAWDKTKSFASSAGNAIVSGAKATGNAIGDAASWVGDKASAAASSASAFANKDENINRKNTALGSMLPTALTGAGIYSAVDAGQKGFIQQGASAGSKLSGSLGVVGGAVTGGLGAAELYGAYKSGDTRRGLLGAADVASGGLSVASGGLSIAGTAGMAIPGLGIASAGLDTVVQGGKSIYAHKQMNKLAAMQDRIKERNGPDFGTLSPGQGYTGDMKKQYALLNIAKEAMDVRRKQRNRAGINAVGSAIETAGHSTVVGAGVTGIGAAVGMGLVAGGKGIKGIAALVRGAKQKMIDKGWVGKGKDDERTTENKEKRAQAFIENVLENHDDPEVIEAMDALGANKDQIELLKKGELPRADIYKLYKAR